jgi:hypothetical protein
MTDRPLSAAEHMAVAVLRGDLTAARALADCLVNDYGEGGREIPPLRRVTANRDRVRVILYLKDGVEVDMPASTRAVAAWLSGDGPLFAAGVDRVELFEVPGEG